MKNKVLVLLPFGLVAPCINWQCEIDLPTFCFPVQLSKGCWSGLLLNLPTYVWHPRKLSGFFGDGTGHSGFKKVVSWKVRAAESAGETEVDQHNKANIAQDQDVLGRDNHHLNIVILTRLAREE